MDENIKKQLDDVCNVIDEKLEKSARGTVQYLVTKIQITTL